MFPIPFMLNTTALRWGACEIHSFPSTWLGVIVQISSHLYFILIHPSVAYCPNISPLPLCFQVGQRFKLRQVEISRRFLLSHLFRLKRVHELTLSAHPAYIASGNVLYVPSRPSNGTRICSPPTEQFLLFSGTCKKLLNTGLENELEDYDE